MAADPLGGRVDDDVRAVLDGSAEVGRRRRCCRPPAGRRPVGDIGEGGEVGDVEPRVRDRLDVDRLGSSVMAGKKLSGSSRSTKMTLIPSRRRVVLSWV